MKIFEKKIIETVEDLYRSISRILDSIEKDLNLIQHCMTRNIPASSSFVMGYAKS